MEEVKIKTNCNIQQLTDSSLENVSAGAKFSAYAAPGLIATFFIAGGTLGGIGCSIANNVYNHRASKALEEGNVEDSEKYTKIAKRLSFATTSLNTISVLSAAAIFIKGAKLMDDSEAIVEMKKMADQLRSSR